MMKADPTGVMGGEETVIDDPVRDGSGAVQERVEVIRQTTQPLFELN
jgi:hypothetical protein